MTGSVFKDRVSAGQKLGLCVRDRKDGLNVRGHIPEASSSSSSCAAPILRGTRRIELFFMLAVSTL